MAKRKIRKRTATRRRAPDMTSERLEAIVSILNNWTGRLTWFALCKKVEAETGDLYTRQALNNYVQIKAAYAASRGTPSPAETDEPLSEAEQTIIGLKRKVAELEAVRDTLLEKFARWAVNASTRNLDESFLDQPLRPINRAENR